MEESFYLASSMSPKINKNLKPIKVKVPVKLGLRKSVKRISILKPPAPKVVNLIENSSSSESVIEDIIPKFDKCVITPAEPITPTLSKEKKNAISQWIAQSPLECGVTKVEEEEINVSIFSTVSSIVGPDHDRKDIVGVGNSTFVGNRNCLHINELFKSKVSVSKVTPINNKLQDSPEIINSTDDESENLFKTPIKINREVAKQNRLILTAPTNKNENKLAPIINDEASQLLDEIYGKSWRDNENLIHKQSKSEVKKQTKNILVPNTKLLNPVECVSLISDDECDKFQYRTPVKTINKENKCKQVEIKRDMVNENQCTPAKSDEAIKLLDELYGNSWRDKEHLVFSEPRPVKKEMASLDSKKVIATVKSKKTIKPPNLNVLKTPVPKSPWAERFKNLVDSDSTDNENEKSASSGGSDKVTKPINDQNLQRAEELSTHLKTRMKLNYDDEESDSEVYVTKPKKTVEKVTKKPQQPRTYTFLESLTPGLPDAQCDQTAAMFRRCYSDEKARSRLTNKLFEIYNEKVFDKKIQSDTAIEWNPRLTNTAGQCMQLKRTHRSGQVERRCKLILSPKVLDAADRLRDTLIHEMCHAATFIVNGVKDGHGPYWKAWAQKAMETFPELPPIKRCHSYVITTKYTYKCTSCAYSFGRHKKSLDLERKRCGYCYGKFEVLINKVTKSGETKSMPSTPRPNNEFAKFVKDNYATVRTPLMKHGDAMKVLSAKYKENKQLNTK